MKVKLFLNRQPLPDRVSAGEALTVQVTPFGDWPHGECVQHVTREACESMISAWTKAGKPEILVDFDHDAEDGKSTVAAAWASNLRIDDERGLVADFKFTDKGAEAVSSRRFRFLSPCWDVEVGRWRDGGKEAKNEKDAPAEVTPSRLVSIALTNKPNIPVDPVLNRDPEPGVKTVEDKKGKSMDPKKIREALGLPEDATDEQVFAAIKEGQDGKAKAAELQANAEKAALEKEAEEFAEKNSKKCNKEVIKAQYLANKEATIALVNAMPEPKAAPICNKQNAKTPKFENRADADAKVLEKYENMSPGKDKDEFLMANAIVINRARNARDAAE